MARGRIISSTIWENPKFAALNRRQQLLLIGLITNADDQGRLRAHPNFVRSIVFPYSNISARTIEDDLGRIAENKSILRYREEGQPYLQILNWWKHQKMDWATPSEHPAPDGWKDRVNYRYKGKTLCCNWGDKEDTCDQHGLPVIMGNVKDSEKKIKSGPDGLQVSTGKVKDAEKKIKNGNLTFEKYTTGKYGDYVTVT